MPICNVDMFNGAAQETKDYINGIRCMLTTGFYYSFDYDLSNIYYRQPCRSKLDKSEKSPVKTNEKDKDVITSEKVNETANEKINEKPNEQLIKECTPILTPNIPYMWNYSINKFFSDNQINPIFSIVVICGYVGISTNIDLYGEKIQLMLISRRNTNMPGTRHNCKGIDDFGNTANFVESEQILKSNKKLFSFVIYRGSPFVFYRKRKYESGLRIVNKPTEIIESSINKCFYLLKFIIFYFILTIKFEILN